MNTAIITGAGAGLGLEFVRRLEQDFPEVEQVWLIGRTAARLEQAAALLQRAEGKIVALDLCSLPDLEALERLLEEEKPRVTLLVNNAGCGALGNVGEGAWNTQTAMVDLNVRALTAVCAMAVPYLAEGGCVINLSSIASFCPNPRMTVYSATKFYVSAFSRGLGQELKGKGITVTAVCPGPMDTTFLDAGDIRGNSKMFEMLPYCDPVKVAKGACAAAKAGRAVYTPRGFFKFYRVLAKVLPQRLMVKFTKT